VGTVISKLTGMIFATLAITKVTCCEELHLQGMLEDEG
jgi:hypothetical protein